MATGPVFAMVCLWMALVLAGYVCALIAVVKMFQNDDRAWAIVSILTFPLPIVALVRLWLKRNEWNARLFTLVWLLVAGAGMLLSVGPLTGMPWFAATDTTTSDDAPVPAR